MNIHDKSYPMTTSKLNPDEPKKLVTLFEHFRADPRGAASYPEWLNDRVWELLQRPGHIRKHEWEGSYTHSEGFPLYVLVEQSSTRAVFDTCHARVELLDGTIVKEWLPETKESYNVEKA